MMPKVKAFSIQTLLPSYILTTRELPGVAQLYIQMGKSLRETATHSNTVQYQNSSFSKQKKCLSYIDIRPWIKQT